MQELLKATREDRAKYFQEATARSKNIKNVIIIEKDFWACWVLDQIFSNPTLSQHLTFKGGTSLSKCYSIIDRFSEDIDLTLAKEYIDITADNDPATAKSTNQRGNRLEALTKKVSDKITNTVKPLLTEEFRKNLTPYFDNTEWQLETDEEDEQSLIFHYPTCFEKKSDGYIQSSIKLEFGARGDINPCETKSVTTYAQQLLPELFDSPTQIKVTVLSAKRTYWEKITLLHAEYHRDPKKPLPARLFRHYYDIAMLDKNNLTYDALQDTSLLSDVVQNKIVYFPSKWANYDEANIGTLRIYPHEAFIEQLKQDHKNMTEMFFGNTPDFNDTLSATQNIERVINNE
jgi:hypothetical protein